MSANVLVLTPIYPWAGNPQDGVFVRQQIRNLQKNGLRCKVVAFRYCPRGVPASLWRVRYSRQLEGTDSTAGFRVHDVFVSRSLNRTADVVPEIVSALTNYIVREPELLKTDVVYAHWLWPAGAAALELRRRLGWPVAAIARGSEMHKWQRLNPYCRHYVQTVIHDADRLLTNCSRFRDDAGELVADISRPIDVVYNGCNIDLFTPAIDRAEAKRALGFAPDRKLLLFCGSVVEHKGIRNLAQAWHRFSEARPEWQLAAVGRLVQPELVRLLRRTRGAIVVGPVKHEEIVAYLQAADMYVQPSILEGLANATMEAMAAALPVIATDTGGQRELITAGYNGMLIPVGDSRALVNALVAIADDPAAARHMGMRARETIVRRFSQDVQIARLHNVLRETAALNPRHGRAEALSGCPEGISRMK